MNHTHCCCVQYGSSLLCLSVGKPKGQTLSIAPRSKPTGVTSRSPAPQSIKPHMGPHTLGPLSPRASSSHSPGGHMTKYTLLMVILRWQIRAPEAKNRWLLSLLWFYLALICPIVYNHSLFCIFFTLRWHPWLLSWKCIPKRTTARPSPEERALRLWEGGGE